MQVSVEAPSKLERRLTIVVPVENFEVEFEKKIAELAQTANVKGFRPGKVPVSYIKQHYGDSARKEALNEVMKASLYDAFEKEKLNPVAAPAIEPKKIQPGEPIEFIATFEVFPEIKTVNFKTGSLEKEISTLTDEDINTVLDQLRKQRTKWKKVDRKAAENDQVIIDFSGTIDGKPFDGGQAHQYPVVIGSKTMLPGFEEGLVGTEMGQEKVISIDFPDTYYAKEVAGKKAEFTINVHKISEPELPEINTEFVKQLGIKSGKVEDLQTEIRRNLQNELDRLVKSKLKNKVFNLLMEQNEIDVPKTLVEQEAHRIHDEMHPHHRGQEHGHSADEMAGFNDAAKRSVILGLLIGEYAKQHQISPSKERVHAFIQTLASSYENPSEVLQYYASDRHRLAEVEMQVLEEQIVEKLLESIKVTEKTVKYSELTGRN